MMIFRCRWPLFVRPMAILRLHVIAMAPCPLPVWLHGLPVASWPRLAAICCNKKCCSRHPAQQAGCEAFAKRAECYGQTAFVAVRNVPYGRPECAVLPSYGAAGVRHGHKCNHVLPRAIRFAPPQTLSCTVRSAAAPCASGSVGSPALHR